MRINFNNHFVILFDNNFYSLNMGKDDGKNEEKSQPKKNEEKSKHQKNDQRFKNATVNPAKTPEVENPRPNISERTDAPAAPSEKF